METACGSAKAKRFFACCCPLKVMSGNRIFGARGQSMVLGSRVKSRKKGQNSTFFKNGFLQFLWRFYESRGRRTQKKWFWSSVSAYFGLKWGKSGVEFDTFSSCWKFDFFFEKVFLWKCREFFSLSDFVKKIFGKSIWSQIS